MDALIRFCFLINPEDIDCPDKYAKLYGQAKWVIDYTGLMEAKRLINNL